MILFVLTYFKLDIELAISLTDFFSFQDDKLRRLSIASNAVSLFGYPWEWMLLFVECYYLFQGAFTAEGPHWLGNVNVTSWIVWLLLETIRYA